MKIVADRDIPGIADAFADRGELLLLPGREIAPRDLRDCRCLITRTVTRVDRALLAGSDVEFVGSATIGTDHVDLDFLAAAGIEFASAPGCNAEAVAEYVVAGLFELSRQRQFDPRKLRAGIVGHGNVGSRLADKFDLLGIDTLLCDPPLAESRGDTRSYQTLDTLIGECNLLCLHTPLTRDGAHPTFHLLDDRRLRRLGRDTLLINTSRGEVIDNRALLEVRRRRDDLVLFIDTWEFEPRVLGELLALADLATPHVAGYSAEGRLRGTQAVRDAAGRHFGWPDDWRMASLLPPPQALEAMPNPDALAFWRNLFRNHWDIRRDHRALFAAVTLDDRQRGIHFDGLRRDYRGRYEYDHFRLSTQAAAGRVDTLRRLGFVIEGAG